MSERPLIYSKLAEASKLIGAIGKDRVNKSQNFKFRGIDDVLNGCHEAFNECGIIPVPRVMNVNREEREAKSGGTLIFTVVTMQVEFFAEDGSSVTAVTVGEGMDSSDKGASKAQSVAYKNCMFLALCIPVAGGMPDNTDDDYGDSSRRQPTQPVGAGGGKVADDPMSQFWAAWKADRPGISTQEGAAFLKAHGGDPTRATAALSKKD